MVVISVDPSELRYSQDTIANKFQDGTLLTETVKKLRTGVLAADVFPLIDVFWNEHLGAFFAYDNRRLYCFKEAKVPLLQVNCVQQKPRKKISTVNDGASITVRQKHFSSVETTHGVQHPPYESLEELNAVVHYAIEHGDIPCVQQKPRKKISTANDGASITVRQKHFSSVETTHGVQHPPYESLEELNAVVHYAIKHGDISDLGPGNEFSPPVNRVKHIAVRRYHSHMGIRCADMGCVDCAVDIPKYDSKIHGENRLPPGFEWTAEEVEGWGFTCKLTAEEVERVLTTGIL